MELRRMLRGELTTLHHAEWHRKRGRERARKCNALIVDPFGFTKKLLGQKRSGQLSCTVEEINCHLRSSFSDSQKDLVPLVCLWKALRVIWEKGSVPSSWQHVEGFWIPKEENTNGIEKFRIICQLSVECKIFFKILANRLTGFLMKNTNIGAERRNPRHPGVPSSFVRPRKSRGT